MTTPRTTPTTSLSASREPDRRWLLRLMQLQFQSNCISSVAIEVPALRRKAEALRKALG